MEWNGMKRIILEYSSLPFFGSFNGENGKSIPLFESLRLRLGGGNRMEQKRMKRIILECSSIPLFGNFNGGNGKPIPLFGNLSKRESNGQEGTLISLCSLKTSNFHSPQNQEELERIELDLMIFLLKLPKYPCIFNSLF